MKNSTYFSFLLAGLTALFSCGEQGTSGETKFDENKLREPLIEANKNIVDTEDQIIQDFMTRYGWEMEKTGTGLRFAIVEQGNGIKAEKGKIVVMDYNVRLLNGDLIYSSEQTGFKEFEIGRGGVETGLEEAILLMKVGDRARIIIPSHLAWGLTGDQNKITPRSTLVYEIKVIDFK